MNAAAESTDTVPGYRLGDTYRLEPWSESGQDAREVALTLGPGAYVARCAGGELLVYAPDHCYGARLMTALALGLCRVADPAGHGT